MSIFQKINAITHVILQHPNWKLFKITCLLCKSLKEKEKWTLESQTAHDTDLLYVCIVADFDMGLGNTCNQ